MDHARLAPTSVVELDPGEPAEPRLLGRSPAMAELRAQLDRLAALALPVLVRGETGTGKELAARTLHEGGGRARPGRRRSDPGERPFVALNCGAIPAGLVESELFGHRRGAFTGADRDHDGAFTRAAGGTLFLDEVGELPMPAQIKLLRVLETRRLTPVGGSRELPVGCRIVSATHRDLRAMVAAGSFREDLFHRLGVVELELPPLRRRAGDIPALLAQFADQAAAELGRPVTLTPEAVAAAREHPWPGNVRALRNAVLRAAALADGPIGASLLLPSSSRDGHGRGYLGRGTISVPRGSYASMQAALLRAVVAEEGSIRKAARALDVPRSTLGAWLRNARDAAAGAAEDHHDAPGEARQRQPQVVNEMANGRDNSRLG